MLKKIIHKTFSLLLLTILVYLQGVQFVHSGTHGHSDDLFEQTVNLSKYQDNTSHFDNSCQICHYLSTSQPQLCYAGHAFKFREVILGVAAYLAQPPTPFIEEIFISLSTNRGPPLA